MVSVTRITTRRVKMIGIHRSVCGTRRCVTTVAGIVKYAATVCVHGCKNKSTALKEHGDVVGRCEKHVTRWRLLVE